MHIQRRSAAWWCGSFRFILILAALTIGCRPESEDKINLPESDIKTVMEAHVDELMGISGVTAVAIGELANKTPCIKIYVFEKTEELEKRIPTSIEGHPVVVTVSGEITPMSGDNP